MQRLGKLHHNARVEALLGSSINEQWVSYILSIIVPQKKVFACLPDRLQTYCTHAKGVGLCFKHNV